LGVYYSLAYGIALTNQFGRKLKTTPQALMDFAVEQDESNNADFIQSMPSGEGPFLVFGVHVNEGAKEGETWVEGIDTLKDIHHRYLEVLNKAPPSVQALVNDTGLVPRLCVLAGNF
jgi:hypothetical protein